MPSPKNRKRGLVEVNSVIIFYFNPDYLTFLIGGRGYRGLDVSVVRLRLSAGQPVVQNRRLVCHRQGRRPSHRDLLILLRRHLGEPFVGATGVRLTKMAGRVAAEASPFCNCNLLPTGSVVLLCVRKVPRGRQRLRPGVQGPGQRPQHAVPAVSVRQQQQRAGGIPAVAFLQQPGAAGRVPASSLLKSNRGVCFFFCFVFLNKRVPTTSSTTLFSAFPFTLCRMCLRLVWLH